MRNLLHIALLAGLAAPGAIAGTSTPARIAITTFNDWCFKAGQTVADARTNMQADGAPFTLTFWDDSLEPRPADAPEGVERRCEVAFDGDHTAEAMEALRAQMATAPVFGTPIPLPDTHSPASGTTLIEGRELLRGRVAVVHVGTRNAPAAPVTFMAVDRLYAGLGLPGGSSPQPSRRSQP
ncbi:hypothetical protein BOO69_13725 [Sulfitobacter alexandrii]|uniref:Uncharacterized protein n=1 Tax=Sulfitobacter alexandrii TaxID=1917485 RepID=A0A1J0WJ33_9RHOB|nr:hypothetical protein [Sulfitobacter alexandrii]APE44343.1 hypothetical protein BOO69_13725 [Sulfitobacter alexandrii]